MGNAPKNNIFDSFNRIKRDIEARGKLNEQQEKELSIRILSGDTEAVLELTEGNLHLLVREARKNVHYGAELQDLIMSGYEGLHRAAEMYDWEKGKFATYATWWIRRTMQSYIMDEHGTIRKPTHIHGNLRHMKAIVAQTEALENRKPTVEEIRERAFINPHHSMKTLMEAWALQVISLDKPNKGKDDFEEGKTLIETIADTTLPGQDIYVYRKQIKSVVSDLLTHLDEKERFIIEKRYGLNGSNIMTLGEVGDALKVSRQRVEQIEKMIRAKLRRVIDYMVESQNPDMEADFNVG